MSAQAAPQQMMQNFVRGDLDAVANCFTEDCVITMHVDPAKVPHGGVHKGREAAKKFFQTVAEGIQLLGGENTYKVCDGQVVIWRGWSQIRVKPTGKTGKMQYVITYKVVDGKISTYDELTDSAVEEELFTKD